MKLVMYDQSHIHNFRPRTMPRIKITREPVKPPLPSPEKEAIEEDFSGDSSYSASSNAESSEEEPRKKKVKASKPSLNQALTKQLGNIALTFFLFANICVIVFR